MKNLTNFLRRIYQMISEEKEFEENNEDDYEIVLPDDMDCSNIKLTPAIKQYSIWRVKEFFYLTE